jgi:hypothetical protein
MTDRYNSLTVVLEKNIRSDDAEVLIEAIKCLRGVLSVKPRVNEITDHVAYERVRRELGEKLWAVLYPEHVKK